ncbi:MAG: O-antigen ligase family protein [Brevinemataceae bacterium]
MSNVFIKKYPAEAMGIFFTLVFAMLILAAILIKPQAGVISIPLYIAIIVFLALLIGLVSIYLYANNNQVHGWRLTAELFIMMAAICASLSDLFWIFLAVASIVIITGRLKEKTLRLNNIILYLWGILIVVGIVSSWFALESRALSFGALFGIILYSLYFTAVFNQDFYHERGSDFVQRIVVLLSFSVVVTVLFSLWHFYFVSDIIELLIFRFQPSTGYVDSFGMASLYGHWPTHSSAFLGLVFWVLVAVRIEVKDLSRIRKYIVDIGMLFSLIGVFATLSRNAFLFLAVSFVLAFIILGIVSKNKKSMMIFSSFLVLMSGILMFFINRFPKWALLLTEPLKQRTILDRIQQYQFGIDQFAQLDNKWTGIGLMNFGPFYRRIQNNPSLTDYLHQLFLSLLLEIGIVGLFVFGALLGVITVTIAKNVIRGKKSPIFLIVLLSWLITGCFDNWLYFVWSSSLFMVFIALGAAPQSYVDGDCNE